MGGTVALRSGNKKIPESYSSAARHEHIGYFFTHLLFSLLARIVIFCGGESLSLRDLKRCQLSYINKHFTSSFSIFFLGIL